MTVTLARVQIANINAIAEYIRSENFWKFPETNISHLWMLVFQYVWARRSSTH